MNPSLPCASSTRSGVAERFNFIDFPKGTRSVAITGKTVVFDSADDAGLVERTHDDQDIRTLTIDAQTVVFRRAMHWPGTAVTIRAEEVRFDGVVHDRVSGIGDLGSVSIRGLCVHRRRR